MLHVVYVKENTVDIGPFKIYVGREENEVWMGGGGGYRVSMLFFEMWKHSWLAGLRDFRYARRRGVLRP